MDAKNEPEPAATAESSDSEISFSQKASETYQNTHTTHINDINDKIKGCRSKHAIIVRVRAPGMLNKPHLRLYLGNI